MQDGLIGVVIGILVASLAAIGARSLGWLEIRLSASPEPASRAAARVHCEITVEEKHDPRSGGTAHRRLFTTVTNEGTAAAQALKGHCRVLTPDKARHAVIRIQRSRLEPGEQYLESYRFDEELHTAATLSFDVEVDFDYQLPSEEQPRHYAGRFRYDRNTRAVTRL